MSGMFIHVDVNDDNLLISQNCIQFCHRYFGRGTCRFGDNCSQAHSDEELLEWKERFEYKKQRMQRAKEDNLQSDTYAEQLLQKWMSADNPETVVGHNRYPCGCKLSYILMFSPSW